MAFRQCATAYALAILLCSSARGQAQDVEPVQPWELLGSNLGRIYGWPNLMFTVSAFAVTPPLVAWADEPVQEFFQEENPLTNSFGDVTLIAGYALPIVTPLTVYLVGYSRDPELTTAGAAAIQAVVVQAVVVGTLKWLTDRAGPYVDGDPQATHFEDRGYRNSKYANDFDFNPFAISGGLRWPSGHTASNVALVSSLVAFYPDELWLPLVGYPIALAIGVGMVEGDYHWLSDVVAGGLMGHVIGWQIGKGFRERFDALRRGEPKPAIGVTLGLSADPLGASVSGQF